jgi:NAD(P)-dependent dehydrogenase (short-subunit alcohol dehydrogenase family)
MKFKNKVVVVTGAGSGIGLAAARLFAKEGASVAVNDVRRDAAQQATDGIVAGGGCAIMIPGDVTNKQHVNQNVQEIMARFGKIDVLINNAAILANPRPAEEYDIEPIMAVNVGGMFNWAKSVAVASMIPNKRGVIVQTGSLASFKAIPDVGYDTSKHAVLGLTRTLALEWAKYNIRVNGIAPGVTDTPAFKNHNKNHPEWQTMLNKRIPMGRVGQPEEQARVMMFLASDDAAYVTGVLIPVDGGLCNIL